MATLRLVDWRLYHSVNTFVGDHSWLGSIFRFIETYGTIALGVAAFALWFLARPGGDPKWKFASGFALASAALGLLVNMAISTIWHRDRPYQTHHVAHIWGPFKTDASFPSTHASAAFGIAVAVLLLSRLAGYWLLTLAVLVSVGRVIVGEHYPGDVVAGVVVGTLAALVVVRFGRPVIAFFVRLVERVSDPLLAPLWRMRAGRTA